MDLEIKALMDEKNVFMSVSVSEDQLNGENIIQRSRILVWKGLLHGIDTLWSKEISNFYNIDK